MDPSRLCGVWCQRAVPMFALPNVSFVTFAMKRFLERKQHVDHIMN